MQNDVGRVTHTYTGVKRLQFAFKGKKYNTVGFSDAFKGKKYFTVGFSDASLHLYTLLCMCKMSVLP